MQAHNLEAAVYFPPDEEPDPELPVDEYRQSFKFGTTSILLEIKRGRRVIWINLTALTEEELTMLRELINLGIDLALPITRYVDEQAHEANERGTMFIPRTFRVRPVLHRRDLTTVIPDNPKEQDAHSTDT